MIELAQNPWVLALLAVAVVAILVTIALLLRRSNAADEEAEALDPWPEAVAEDVPPAPLESVTTGIGLRQSFRRAMGRLRSLMPSSDFQYRIPWVAVYGVSTNSRSYDHWARAGASLPYSQPDHYSDDHRGCNWWFFDRGALIDLGGDYVGSDGGKSPELDTFLELCQEFRPRRPLDGLVVNLSCRELLRAAGQGPQGAAMLKEQSVQIYQALWQTQQKLGLQLPVYVLCTEAEVIEGFPELCSALPQEVTRGIFGWSSPYHLDIAYSGDWVRETFDTLRQRLHRARLEIFSSDTATDGVDALFNLPRAIEALEQPLRLCLDQILRPSLYHEPLLVRGLYLSGEHTPAQSTSISDPRHTAFLAELLEHKVFAESNIARPTEPRLVATNRKVRRLQALVASLALILGLGTGWATFIRYQNGDRLEGILRKAGENRHELQEQKTAEELATIPLESIEDLAAIRLDRFNSWMIPASWFSDFEDKLKVQLHYDFQNIILEALVQYKTLQAWDAVEEFAAVAQRDPRLPTPQRFIAHPSKTIEPPQNTDEFVALRAFVNRLHGLEQTARLLNNLRRDRPLERFVELVENVYNTSMPEGFSTHSDLYREALMASDKTFDFTASPRNFEESGTLCGATQEVLQGLTERFYRRITEQSPLLTQLEALESRLQGLRSRQRAGLDTEPYEALLQDIRDSGQILTYPEFAWAFNDTFFIAEDYEHTLGSIQRSPGFFEPRTECGTDARQDIERYRRQGEATWSRFRTRLLELSARPVADGTLLALLRNQPQMELSADVQLLAVALGDFLGTDFMSQHGTCLDREEQPNATRLRWSVPVLEEAAAAFEPYEGFTDNTLDLFPASMEASLSDLGRRHLLCQVKELADRARDWEPISQNIAPRFLERQLRSEVSDLVAAAPVLDSVIANYRSYRSYEELETLEGDIARQAHGLLGATEQLLLAEDLYQPLGNTFAWWDGRQNLAFEAFDTADEAELSVHLQIQRQRLIDLSNELARPVVTWLGKWNLQQHPELRQDLRFWEPLLVALDDYEASKPGNGLSLLEQFITEDMANLTLSNCRVEVGWDRRNAGGFVAGIHRDLRQGVLKRCQDLGLLQYNREIEAFFNQHLAGRYPFAEIPEELVPEAEVDFLKTFYQRYDRQVGILNLLPRGSEPARFIQNISDTRQFFAHYLDAEPQPQEPVFDFEVDFRSYNQPGDGSHEIIEWTLDVVGYQTIRRRDPEQRGRWAPDRPLRLTLRWAKDSRRYPVSATDGQVSLDGDTVTFEFKNRWSLLRMLDAHRASAADIGIAEELAPITLRFDVQTERRPLYDESRKKKKRKKDQESPIFDPLQPETLRVFLSFEISAPDSKDPLTLPIFPKLAPEADRVPTTDESLVPN